MSLYQFVVCFDLFLGFNDVNNNIAHQRSCLYSNNQGVYILKILKAQLKPYDRFPHTPSVPWSDSRVTDSVHLLKWVGKSPVVNYMGQNFVNIFIFNRKPLDCVVFLNLPMQRCKVALLGCVWDTPVAVRAVEMQWLTRMDCNRSAVHIVDVSRHRRCMWKLWVRVLES